MPGFGLIFGKVLTVFDQKGAALTNETTKWALVFVGLGFANLIVNFFQFGCFGVVGERLTRKLRYNAMKSMLRQSMSFFDDKMNGTGALTARLAEEAVIDYFNRNLLS